MVEVFWIDRTNKNNHNSKSKIMYLSNTARFHMELAKQAAKTTMYGFVT
jgi:hypothetical protein